MFVHNITEAVSASDTEVYFVIYSNYVARADTHGTIELSAMPRASGSDSHTLSKSIGSLRGFAVP